MTEYFKFLQIALRIALTIQCAGSSFFDWKSKYKTTNYMIKYRKTEFVALTIKTDSKCNVIFSFR